VTSEGAISYLKQWQTDPLSLARMVEMAARVLIAGLVGIGVSAVIYTYGGEAMMATLGLLFPMYVLMEWVVPDE